MLVAIEVLRNITVQVSQSLRDAEKSLTVIEALTSSPRPQAPSLPNGEAE
jgi:hypothetical protein